jgi:hypothetical protein
MSAHLVSGQKRKATQALSSPEPKKSRLDDMGPKEWLMRCGTADQVACTKLRKKLKTLQEYISLLSNNAKTTFLESWVTFLMDNRDTASISKAAQEAIIISETRKQDAAAREAERELLCSTLAGMGQKQSGNTKGQRDKVKSSLKLLLYSFFEYDYINFV